MGLIQVIKGSPLFLELYDEEIETLIKNCQVLSLEPGDSIFKEGEEGKDLYLILSGSVIVKKGNVELSKLGKGELFGELVLINELTRTADCLASTYADILMINHDTIFSLYSRHPRIFSIMMMNISRLLAHRLKKTTIEMRSLHQEVEALKNKKQAA